MREFTLSNPFHYQFGRHELQCASHQHILIVMLSKSPPGYNGPVLFNYQVKNGELCYARSKEADYETLVMRAAIKLFLLEQPEIVTLLLEFPVEGAGQ